MDGAELLGSTVGVGWVARVLSSSESGVTGLGSDAGVLLDMAVDLGCP